jgi:G3E family GTPase
MIKISIVTGFLGSGKTTLINKMIKENPNTKFGLIINEFGEVGVDSELVGESGEEITEISNGCLCCVVRSDLIGAVEKMIDTNKIDYLIIETSGLAEPAPIAQTFLMNDLNGRIELDGIFCMIDAENFDDNIKNYNILKEQIQTADVAIINKISEGKDTFIQNLEKFIQTQNPTISILKNNLGFNTKILIDKKETEDKIEEVVANDHHHDHNHHGHNDTNVHNHDHDHDEHHHHHEHEDFEEVLFTSDKGLDPNKLDQFFLKNFPRNVIRAKGFLNIADKFYLFQMVGSSKKLDPYTLKSNSKLDPKHSYLIFIGKDLDKKSILEEMHKCVSN